MRYLVPTQKRVLLKQRSKQIPVKYLTHIYAVMAPVIRGCTGFDGDLEIMEAIDGPGPSKNLD